MRGCGKRRKGRQRVRRRISSWLAVAIGIGAVWAIALSRPAWGALDRNACTFDGLPLHGRIQVVQSFPDLKVQVVDNFPDLRVQVVENFPDRCGQWQFVEAFPDLKIQYVSAFPDLKIEFATAFPGIP